MDNVHKRLNYSTLMNAVMSRATGKLSEQRPLLNCLVGCKDYEDKDKHYISIAELDKSRLSRMFNEEENPPDEILKGVQTGNFYGVDRKPPTARCFECVLKSFQSPYHVRDLIAEIREIIKYDPFMKRVDKDYLLSFPLTRRHHEFLFECFKYTLARKGNTKVRVGKDRMRRDKQRLIQQEARRRSSNFSADTKTLFDAESIANFDSKNENGN